VHPRATLSKDYAKAEINDLANFAFISAKANRKISDRSPAKYFPELLEADSAALESHLVPEADELRTADRFRDFLAARRRLLARAMTDTLDHWRPVSTDATAPTAADPTTGDTLSISIVSETYDPLDGIVLFEAKKDGQQWSASIPADEFDRFLADLAAGLASDIVIAGERIPIEADAPAIEIPIGPFLVTGSLDDWQKVWAREYEEGAIGGRLPTLPESPPWTDEHIVFSVLVSE
jgi:hypothetical protein